MNLALDFITVRSNRLPGRRTPSDVSLNQTDRVSLSRPGFKEHIVSQRTLGSIGKTLCTRYTEVVVN